MIPLADTANCVDGRVLALSTPASIAKSVLSQLFVARIGNVGLYKILSETYERCQRTLNDGQYEDILWDTVKTALPASLKGAKETVLVVDGVDEATCGQSALLQRLKSAAGNVSNLKMVVLCSPEQNAKDAVNITPSLVFDDIAAVVRRVFKHTSVFNELPMEEEEMLVNRLVKASDGSFLWAKLAAKRVREESPSSGQALVKAVDSFLKGNETVHDIVSSKMHSHGHPDAIKTLGWLATAPRPLTAGEISSLLSVQLDKGTVSDKKNEPLSLLKPFASLIFYQNNMVYLRHGQIRKAVVETYPGAGIKTAQVDLIRRMALYIKHAVTGRDEPSLDMPDSHYTSSVLERHALLDYALRYWLGTTATVYGAKDHGIANAKKELNAVFPSSPLVPLLGMQVWRNKSTPTLLSLHTLQTRLFQQTLGNKHPASLQAILCQAMYYQSIPIHHPDAVQVFYSAVTIAQQVLSTHVITMRMAKYFLDFTAPEVTNSKTELMVKRVEVLQTLVECYKVHYGSSSEVVISTLRILAEHYTFIQELHKAKEITVLLQGDRDREVDVSRRPSDESLIVQLHGPKDRESGTALTLEIEDDEVSGLNMDAFREEKLSHQSVFNQALHSETNNTSESGILELLNSESLDYTAVTNATSTLVQTFFAQHRWKDASRSLKQTLRAVWPSFFAKSISEVVLPKDDSCIHLAQRLRDCYRYRRRTGKEEDTCLRIYHALRHDRPAGDALLRSITSDLLHVYERTRQTEKLVSVHRDILDDFTSHYGHTHPNVLQELWTLAGLVTPQAAALEYHQRIFDILNRDLETCKPEAFEPLLVIVSELFNQARYAELLKPAGILFKSLQTDISPKLHDPSFVQSVYERYTHALRKTHAEYTLIHDVAATYRRICLAVFGPHASITITATVTLAYIAQESKQYELEAVELFESLLKIQSKEVDINHDEIRATLEAIADEQAVTEVTDVTEMTSHAFEKIVSSRVQRMSSIRSTYGWAHETSLAQMEELVSLYARRKETQNAMTLLHETAVHILSESEAESSELIASARSIASCYKRIGQVQRASDLASEIYSQVVVKSTKTVDIKSGQTSLFFLAQLEYTLHEQASPGEIYASLMAEYQYYERFRTEMQSKSSLESILGTVNHLHSLLVLRKSDVSSLLEQFTDFFMEREGQRLQLQHNQANLFLSTIMEYFQKHSSTDFLRSVALACYGKVTELQDTHAASALALTAFRFIHAHDGLAHLPTIKILFNLSLTLCNTAIRSKTLKSPQGHDLLSAAGTIITPVLHTCKTSAFNLSHLPKQHLNTLITLLDAQKSYKDLSWLLNSLWTNRLSSPSQETTQETDLIATLSLGRMLVVTRYLTGEHTSSIRLAEDILYNTARVLGARHPSTLESTILLSQMYTSVAQSHQHSKRAEHRDLAGQYYRKAAGLHENALRVFVDPSSSSEGEGLDSMSSPSSPPSPVSPSSSSQLDHTIGKSIRQHLHLLKLAVERLGAWPKEYAEYEALSAELFRMFGGELRGEKGVEKWDLRMFGGGKAEASDDLVGRDGLGMGMGMGTGSSVDSGMLAIAV